MKKSSFFLKRAPSTLALLLVAGVLGTAQVARGGTYTWTGGPTGTWDTTGTNWSPSGAAWDSVNGNSNSAIFNDSAFSNSFYPNTITTNGALTSLTFSSQISINSIYQDGITITNTTLSNEALALNGRIAGSGGMVINGYTDTFNTGNLGFTWINILGNNTYGNSSDAGTTIVNNAYLIAYSPTALSPNSGIFLNKSNLILANGNATIGFLKSSDGTSNVQNGTGINFFTPFAETLTIKGINSAPVIFSGVIQDGANGFFIIFDSKGGTLSIRKTGLGEQIFSGNNTYTGGTAIAGGILTAASSTAFGTGNITFTNDDTNTSGGILKVANDLSSNVFSNIKNNTSSINLDIATGNTVTASAILDSSNSGGLVFNPLLPSGTWDTGTLTLSGLNAYTGGTTVVSGTLIAASASAFGDSKNTLAVSPMGAVVLTNDLTVGALSDYTAYSANGQVHASGGGTVNLGSSTLTLGNLSSTASTFSGTLTGSGGITLQGKSTQILAGINTYAGDTNINSGTLQIGNGVSAGDISSSSNVNINSKDGNQAALIFNAPSGSTVAVQNLTVNAQYSQGKVVLQNVGTTLQIQGNYTSTSSAAASGITLYSGGVLYLTAALGGDNSLASKVVIFGSASGKTTVVITPTNTAGAQTSKGIRLIEVDGASGVLDSSTFTAAPTDGLVFRYSLKQGALINADNTALNTANKAKGLPSNFVTNDDPNSWYLVSAAKYRPAMIGYSMAQHGNMEVGSILLGSLSSRMGDEHGGQPANAFLDTGGTFLGEGAGDETPRVASGNSQFWGRVGSSQITLEGQSAFDQVQKTNFVQAGLDVYQTKVEGNLVDKAGIMLGLGQSNSDFKWRNLALYGVNSQQGSAKTDFYSAGGYFTMYSDDGSYMSTSAQVASVRNHFTDSTGVDATQTGVGAGATLEIGDPYEFAGTWEFTPQAQVTYQYMGYNSFSDAVGPVDSFSANSLRVSAGTRFGWGKENGGNSFYFSANIHKELLDSAAVTVAGESIKDNVNQDFWGDIGIGGQIKLTDSMLVYGNFNYEHSLFGDRSNTREGVAGSAGVRVTW